MLQREAERGEGKGAVQLVECVPSMYKALGLTHPQRCRNQV